MSANFANSQGSRTILWCVPRSGSTALTKCLSGIPEIETWFEPYDYCHCANKAWKQHSGSPLYHYFVGHEESYREAAELLNQMYSGITKPELLSYTSIKSMPESSRSHHVFVKDMAYALTSNHYRFIPAGYKHTFLIRHPLRVFQSSRKAWLCNPKVSGQDYTEIPEDNFDFERDTPYLSPGLYYKDIFDLWQFIRERFDPNPIVIDGDDLLSKPTELLPKYCNAVGLPYDKSLLHWDSSTEVTKTWKTPISFQDELPEPLFAFYGRSFRSSRFNPPSKMPLADDVTPDVRRCADQVIKYYEQMYEQRIIV